LAAQGFYTVHSVAVGIYAVDVLGLWVRKVSLEMHKVKDNSLKLILAEHELFVEFLRDFIDVDLLKGIAPEDVEDITERFLPLFDENKDSDTVKRIRLRGDEESPLYVIALVEHESGVNFRACFKMLHYITLILSDYEKIANKKRKGVIYRKDFRYPPVLPIVFYDGVTVHTVVHPKTEGVAKTRCFSHS
jgi:hypothetical protein